MSGYSVDPGRVIAETIDGETILIDLVSGAYYSLRGTAVTIWHLAAAGVPADGVVDALAQRYAVAAGEARTAVEPLLEQLVGEGLLEPGATGAAAVGTLDAQTGPGAFEPPVLEKFTDMQDFLLVDPIHEVDAAGWPHTRES